MAGPSAARPASIVGVVCVGLCVWLLQSILGDFRVIGLACLLSVKGALLCVVMIFALLMFDIAGRRVSDWHSLASEFNHYVAVLVLSVLGRVMSRRLDADSRNFTHYQEEMLLGVLKKNKDTDYGKKHRFGVITSREDYVQRHPLTHYSYFSPYVKRIADGEKGVLTRDRPKILAVTSGTSTGVPNLLPMVRSAGANFFLRGIAPIFRQMAIAYPGTCSLQRSLKLFYKPRERVSRGGIPVGPNSSSPANSKRFLNMYTTPRAGYNIATEPEALYVHLLFGLLDGDLGVMEANFSSLIHASLQALQVHGERLAEDIELGRMSPHLEIPPHLRSELNGLLQPNPSRAAEVREALAGGKEGLVRRLWPHINLILTTTSGAFQLYSDNLRLTYCRDVPLYSPLYAATEGLIGVNLWPESEKEEYCLVARSLFYEFIPLEQSSEEQPQTLFADQVMVGETYELVLTNLSGLCRFRFGDVIKVTRFHGTAPVVHFLFRKGQLLNIHGEKTSELALFNAVQSTVSEWKGCELVDFCCADSLSLSGILPPVGTAPHYVVFLELSFGDQGPGPTTAQLDMIDERLCKGFVYNSFRRKGALGCAKAMSVKKGTFGGLRRIMLDASDTPPGPNQYKVPRVLRARSALEFVASQVVQS